MRAMTKGMDAQIRVSGDAALLAGFRERVRQLLVRDPQAPGYEDTLEGSALAFRSALASASLGARPWRPGRL